MSTYKLTYFNITGLGEPVRFLLSYAGIKFEDNRISDEDWPKLKPLMPLKHVPTLEIDGKTYHQCTALCRYIAKKANIAGKDDQEALEIDIAVDSIHDLRGELAMYFWNKEPSWAEQLKKRAFEAYPFYLDKFESIVKTNGGYFVGNKLTWADIFFASLYDYLSVMVEKDITDGYPHLKKIVDEVFDIPNIKAYLAKRPKPKF